MKNPETIIRRIMHESHSIAHHLSQAENHWDRMEKGYTRDAVPHMRAAKALLHKGSPEEQKRYNTIKSYLDKPDRESLDEVKQLDEINILSKLKQDGVGAASSAIHNNIKQRGLAGTLLGGRTAVKGMLNKLVKNKGVNVIKDYNGTGVVGTPIGAVEDGDYVMRGKPPVGAGRGRGAAVRAANKLISGSSEAEIAGYGGSYANIKEVVKGETMVKNPLSPYYKKEVKQLDEKSAAWQRKEGKDPEGGLNKKGVESYRRENPGSKLQTAVTTKPSKLKPGSKSAKRRKSFCSRMKGMKAKLTSAKTARDPDSRINKSLRKWNCE